MTRHFEITFSDLSYEKQQDLIEDVKKTMLENFKDEAESNFLLKPEFKGMSWQEAICRVYNIDWEIWTRGTNKDFNWQYAVENHCEEEAENDLYIAFKHLEVEVQL